MRRMALVVSMTLVLGIAGGVIGSRALNAQQEPVKRTVLLKSDLGG